MYCWFWFLPCSPAQEIPALLRFREQDLRQLLNGTGLGRRWRFTQELQCNETTPLRTTEQQHHKQPRAEAPASAEDVRANEGQSENQRLPVFGDVLIPTSNHPQDSDMYWGFHSGPCALIFPSDTFFFCADYHTRSSTTLQKEDHLAKRCHSMTFWPSAAT